MVYIIITLLICHVKMQLSDVMKSIGWYWAFVALQIQINPTKNSNNTDTGIDIDPLLVKNIIILLLWIL